MGHLAAGEAARAALELDEVLVVPAHDPPHRAAQPRASGFQRFAMAALAIDDAPGFVLSEMELAADEPSFTATTLRRLHGRGFAAVDLFFITGSDAFAEISTWRDYPAILDLAHFIVISRPAWPLDALPSRFPGLARRMRRISEAGSAWGGAEPASPLSIFLVEHRTPDVSSTEVRRRVADGQPIAGLVPPAVARHILRESLYAAGAASR
jgi:nicotinate-nucleotide adenylyltransferase